MFSSNVKVGSFWTLAISSSFFPNSLSLFSFSNTRISIASVSSIDSAGLGKTGISFLLFSFENDLTCLFFSIS